MAGPYRRMFAGVTAVAVGFAVAQLLSLPFGAHSDSRAAVERELIQQTPAMLKTWATHTFGVADKYILWIVVWVAISVIAAMIGVFETRKYPFGSISIAFAGAAGCAAVLAETVASVTALIPTVVGACCAVVTLRRLIRERVRVPETFDDTDAQRRNSLMALSFLGLGVAGGVSSGAHSLLSNTIPADSKKLNASRQVDPVYNVLDYGVAGDGSHGDSGAIQALIDALPSSGGTLLFPAGVYKIDVSLTCSKPIVLSGGGVSPSSTIRLNAQTDLLAISSASNIVIENLHFDGNGQTIGIGTGELIKLTDVSNVQIRNCAFTNGPSAALLLTKVDTVWITGNRFENIYQSGIRLQDPSSGCFNENIWISDNKFDSCQLSKIGGNAAIQAHGTGSISHRYISVIGNLVYNPRVVGIGLDSLDRSRVTGNVVVKDATCSNGETIAFTGSENVISENYCFNLSTSAAAGILCWGVSGRTNARNQIINNRLTNAGQGVGFTWGEDGAEISDLLIQGNHCYGNNIGIQSWNMPDVTSGSQTTVVIANNNLVGNTLEALNLVQNGAGGITGEPTVFGQQISVDGEQVLGNRGLKLDGAWNAGHLLLGSYHLWVDGSGSLRISSSPPASDTDGTVVGAQT